MSKIKSGGTGPFEQQQFGTTGVEGVNLCHTYQYYTAATAASASHLTITS